MASRALLCIVALITILSLACADPAHNIVVDGDLSDWENVQSYYDPEDLPDGSVVQDGIPDVHDTDSKGRCDKPPHVYNPIVDILEVKFTHSASHLFAVRLRISLCKLPGANSPLHYFSALFPRCNFISYVINYLFHCFPTLFHAFEDGKAESLSPSVSPRSALHPSLSKLLLILDDSGKG
jgi:hypothetical protein